MIVDFHAHVFQPDIIANRDRYLALDRTFAELFSDPKAKMSTADELVESMDANGIDMAVVVNFGWSEHDVCVETNDYILESARRYPEKLVPFCSINPLDGQDALAEIERCVGLGARGIGELHPDPQGYQITDRDVLGPVMETAQRHNLIVMTHSSEPVGHKYPGKGTVTPEKLHAFVEDFPEVTIVCAHWGGGLPFFGLMPEVANSLKRVYFDSAASPLLYTPQVFSAVAESVGVGKILFGTDYPLISHKRILDQIEGLTWPRELKDRALGGNAKDLLGL